MDGFIKSTRTRFWGPLGTKWGRIGIPKGSTTIRLRTFRPRHFVYRHFVYRHFVYYCIPAYRTVIHPTSVSEYHYFHQFQLLLTLGFLFINPTPTDTMIIQHT